MTDSLRTTPAFAVGGEAGRGDVLLRESCSKNIWIVSIDGHDYAFIERRVDGTVDCDIIGHWGLSLAAVEQLRDGLNRAIEKMKELQK